MTADRLPPQSTGTAANAERFFLMCGACHGDRGQGRTYPSLVNHPELADPAALGRFLATVPPPMPRLYPGPLDRDDLRMIADQMRIITGGPTAAMEENLLCSLESEMFELPHDNELPAPDGSSLCPHLRRHARTRRQGRADVALYVMPRKHK